MLTHTPFDGSHPLFKIGLQPLELEDWIEIDKHLPFYLSEKKRLMGERPEDVFVAEPETAASQGEVLALIVDHLKSRFTDRYVFHAGDSAVDVPEAGASVDLKSDTMPDLVKAALLVQEDLIIMRKGDDGWRLAAASLCFPSSWHLLEKFSKPLHAIHQPVPGFGPGTRNATMIERIFDNIQIEQPVRRFNWSVYSDDELFHADREAERLNSSDLSAGAFIRVEHQTLRKLPHSGDILFTVRIHLDPLEALERHSGGGEIRTGFIRSLRDLNTAELAYKGLTDEVDELISKLEAMAGEDAQA